MLREVRYRIGTPGFRSRQMTLVTTWLSPEVYAVADLADLYRVRWQVEISQPPYDSREHLSPAAA